MYNWKKVKSEYISTDIGYRELAKKHGISFSNLSQRATKEKWVGAKKEYREKTVTKTLSKISNRESTKLASLRSASDKMARVIDKMLDDVDQFSRHIVQTKDGDLWDAEERIFAKLDSKAIKDISASIKELAIVQRNLYGLITVQEQATIDIARERLEIDKQKANVDQGDDTESGVVMLAPVLEEPDSSDEDGGDA